MSEFVMTRDHLTLLRRAYWRASSMESGAPGMDPKRPFGNSCVECDIADILGLDVEADEDRIWTLFDELLPAIEWCIANAPTP